MVDIEALWDYHDPAASEARFQAALAQASADEQLELHTQIARTYSIRRQIDQAHALLDSLQTAVSNAGPAPRIRWLLERGRTFNSAGDREQARPLFVQAWETALANGFEGLAVDAAHMVAITHQGTPDALVWNQRALECAKRSTDAKAQSLIPGLLNNMGWDLHDANDFPAALGMFQAAEEVWKTRAHPQNHQIARWAVGRCLRSMGRYEEALAIQQALYADHQAAGTQDGYVLEELFENLLALDKVDQARGYAHEAVAVLGMDEWFVDHESVRFQRLKSFAV